MVMQKVCSFCNAHLMHPLTRTDADEDLESSALTAELMARVTLIVAGFLVKIAVAVGFVINRVMVLCKF
jgi:hypothetical protein